METVLVVESEAITRCCWTDALLNRGYRVLEARNSSDAFDLMGACPAELVSALLIEVFFSDLNATNLARRMKEANPELCVIASSTMRSRDFPVDLPYDAVLRKPVNSKEVLAVLEKLLHGRLQKSHAQTDPTTAFCAT